MALTNEHTARENIPAFGMHTPSGSRVFSGRLSLANGRLNFVIENGGVDWPLSEIQLRVGGHNDEQVFFTNASQPDWVIYSSDRSILLNPVFSSEPNLRVQAEAARRQTKRFPTALAALLVFVALVITGVGCLVVFKSALASMAAVQIPASWEKNLGSAVFEQIKASGQLSNDPELNASIQALAAPLVAIVQQPDLEFQFHVSNDTNINAFAMPGGYVVVNKGLILAADNAEEVIGVLAHEIAHVTQRHSLRNMIESAGLFLLLQAMIGDASGILTLIANNSQMLLRQKFSRDFEREADDVGWNYLVQAQIDPRGLIRFFEKLQNAQSGAAMNQLAFLSTHPATSERIQRLETKWNTLAGSKEFQPIKVDFEQLQKKAGAL